MTKEELITKQQLQIEEFKENFEENSRIQSEIIGKFYNIGQPLNDNKLQMNKDQKRWCQRVVDLAEEINEMLKTES